MVTYPVVRTTRRAWSASHAFEFIPGLTCVKPCPDPHKGQVDHSIKAVESVTLGASSRNWRKAIAAGSNAGSTLSGTRFAAVPHHGGYYYKLLDVGSCCSYGAASGAFGYESFPTVSSVASSTAAAIASEKLLGSYIAGRNSWRGGNFLAEFSETVHMLRHPIESIFGHTTHFVKSVHAIRHLKSRSSYGHKLGSLWLSFVFGWKPLFDDIHDANVSINKLADPSNHDSYRISGSGSVQTSAAAAGGALSLGVSNFTVYDRTLVSTWDQKYYGAIRARPESFATVAETFGISGYDIVPAVWEAVPWSFFVDYFLNVQQVLDSWRFATADLAWLMGGYKNTVTMIAGDSYKRADLDETKVLCLPSISGGKSRSIYKSRAPLISLPYPGFRFKIPGIGSLKWANTAALVAQIAGSRPRSFSTF